MPETLVSRAGDFRRGAPPPDGPLGLDREPPGHDEIDLAALRAYRLAQVRRQLVAADLPACVLFDPLNVRFAVDSTNMQVWVAHNPVRYVFVPAQGPVVMFDFHGCEHRSAGLGTVDEVRPATGVYYFGAGPRLDEFAASWAAEIDDLLRSVAGRARRIALDAANPLCVTALQALGIEVCDATKLMEEARLIKSPEEIACMRIALDAANLGIDRMRAALKPGITENELWALLHQANIERGGEWIETRLLSSGPKTNPWFQECGFRKIEDGDLVSFDTDMIGPYGYCADISRTLLCGDRPASDEQKRLFAQARLQIDHNIAILRPGMSYREFVEKSYPLPERYRANRYSALAHGIGLCDEFPGIRYLEDWERGGYDGVIRAGTTLCVESYVGEEGGGEGVKLEQQVLVSEQGIEILSDYPIDTVVS